MSRVRGKYFFGNSKLYSLDDGRILTGVTTIYEVIRIINFYPLFFHDHFERLQRSCNILNVAIQFSEQNLFRQIVELAQKNGIGSGNVFVEQVGEKGKWNTYIYFIPHQYPTEDMYEQGVALGVLQGERINPKVKVIQSDLRTKANNLIKSSSCYEVLLIDENNVVTEGSRSNVFFIKGQKLFTTPLERVLSGITLKKVMEICYKKNIEVIQTDYSLIDITNADAVFLTGTSPKILPVNSINNQSIRVDNKLLRNLMNELDLLIEIDIKKE